MKLTSVVLSAAIMLGAVSPVFAQTDEKLESAVLEVKQRLNIGEYEDFSSQIMTEDDETVYKLDWATGGEYYDYISVTFSDGIIIGYDRSYAGEYHYGINFPDVSREEALKTAEEFVKKVNPDIYENIEVIPRQNEGINDSSYYFDLVRKENGITVIGNGGNMAVSSNTNEVKYFHIEYETDVEFLPLDGILTLEEAKQKYAENLPFELQYTYYYDYEKNELKVYPQYTEEGEKVLSAINGEVLEVPEYDSPMYRDMVSDMGKGDGEMGLSEVELSEIDKISGLISQEEAEKIIRDNKIINIPEDFELEMLSLSRDYIDKDIYTYYLMFTNEEYYVIGAEVDARTGQILYFYKNGDYSVENQNTETEKQIAEEALKAFGAENHAELVLSENNEEGYVCYERIHNGIKVSENGAYLEFDGADNLISYSFVKTPIKEFPSVDGIKTGKEAFDLATEQIDFGVMYMLEEKCGTPVYCFSQGEDVTNFNLNPFTGKRIDYKGEDYRQEQLISYSDIENHYAKDKFLKLAEYGIGFEGGVLEAYKGITWVEYLDLLGEVFYTTHELDRTEQTPLTREQAANIMVNQMGGSEYLRYNEMFYCPFSDVTESRGPIAYLKAIGVIAGDGNGNFNPENTITRGEALIMIYNYLNR